MSVPGIVASAVVPAGLPIITGLSSTNVSQSVATLNATVDANGSGATTTITFQWKYNSTNFSTGTVFSSVASTTHLGSASFHTNISGLLVDASGIAESLGSGPGGDLWYWRVVATNYSGTTTSAVQNFTTWSLKTYAQTTSGSYSLDIPTVTPTGGSAQSRSIYNVDVVGGGGAASTYQYAGGAGSKSQSTSSTVSGTLTITVGGGGFNSAESGSPSSITGLSSNISAGGGNGQPLANWVNGTRSGSSSNGNAGGVAACFDTSGKTIIGATGGGGGHGGEGGPASCSGGYYFGGVYGAGTSLNPGYGPSNGGDTCCYGGAGWGSPGSQGGSSAPPPSASGNGGNGSTDFLVSPGQSGLVRFRYYGP